MTVAATVAMTVATTVATTVADVIGQALARLGVTHCFGVVGSGNFAVTNALRAVGVPFTAARHEGGAATMADAYARMSGQVGLVSVHQGCGYSNAATGIAEAAKSHTPLIVLAAETRDPWSNFHMDQPGFAVALTAGTFRVESAETVISVVTAAYATARDEHRTVVLNLPLDVQAAPATSEQLRELAELEPPPKPAPRPPRSADVAALAGLLQDAERPIFIAGRGARMAGSELRALAAASGALLATSAVANGLFHDEPFSVGISGGFSSPTTAELIADADLVVSFGCALNMWTTRHGRLVNPDAKIVQIDTDARMLGAHRAIFLGVTADCAVTAKAVLQLLRSMPRPTEPAMVRYRTAGVAERIRQASRLSVAPLDPPDLSGVGEDGELRVDPRVLTRALNDLLPSERIVSVDSGNFMGYPSAYFDVPDEYGFCFTQAFQSIGLGLSTAIGAAIARPDRLPVLGAGDGGFLMSIAELETAVRLRLPLVIVVYNDDAYGAEVHHFAQQHASPGASSGASPGASSGASSDLGTVTFPRVDLAAIARGFGAEGMTVRSVEDVAPLRAWLNGPQDRPILLDARIASDGGSWWLAEAFAAHQ